MKNQFQDTMRQFADQFSKQQFSQKPPQDREQQKRKQKRTFRNIGIVLILLAIFLSGGSFFYTVAEDEVAVVRVFGSVKKVIVDKDNTLAVEQTKLDQNYKDVEIVRDKGLFLKIPFITQVDKDTSKLITYISNTAELNTKDKIKYDVAMYVQWEISHPGLFRSAYGTITQANRKLDEVAYARVIEKINTLMAVDFLTNKDALRNALDKAREELNSSLAPRGIVVRDIDVYRTILPDANIQSTYNKMIAERAAIAQQNRSEGKELYQNTVADTDREVAQIVAESIEKSEKIIGQADAEALEIYAKGFQVDPEFYKLWRTLKAYDKTFDKDTVLYLNSDNDFLKIFSKGR